MAETRTHWKKLMHQNYFGSWDLEGGKDMIVRIVEVKQEVVTNQQGRDELLIAYLDGGLKPLILNKTNCKAIEKALGTSFIEEWAGRKIQLFKERGMWFGEMSDAVRVRDFDPEAK